MKIINNLHKIVFLGLIAALFAGCASMQSMSSYARTGDTITVAVGGTEESNVLVDVLKKEDIVITITDSSAASFPVKLKRLFRVYPDYSSRYIYHSGETGNNFVSSYVPPMIGQWMAVIDLVDPLTDASPVLAVGMATLSVSSVTQLVNGKQYSPYALDNGNLGAIQIEILPGQGVLNTLNDVDIVSYHPLAEIEPMEQIIVEPSADPSVNISGGSFTFVYNTADFINPIKAVPASHDPNVQLMSNRTDLGNGTTQLKVTLLNPKGFLIGNRTIVGVARIDAGGWSPLRSAKFNMVWRNDDGNGGISAVTDQNWQNSIQLVNGQYIDLAGNAVTDITPVMRKTR